MGCFSFLDAKVQEMIKHLLGHMQLILIFLFQGTCRLGQPSLVFALVIHSNILSGGFLFFQLQRYCWLWILINSTEATNYSFCDLSNDLLDSTQSIQLVTILLPIHHKVPISLLIYHSIKDSIEIVWKIQPPPFQTPKFDMKIHFFLTWEMADTWLSPKWL